MDMFKAMKAAEILITENAYLFLRSFAPKGAERLDLLQFSSKGISFRVEMGDGEIVTGKIDPGMFERWRKDIIANQYRALTGDALTRAANWLNGDDNCAASRTLAGIAMGRQVEEMAAPSDVHDFGRCFRLLEAVPEIRDFFPRVARKVPAFAGILESWDVLSHVYWPGMTASEKEAFTAQLRRLRNK